jgi:hypothetical protein
MSKDNDGIGGLILLLGGWLVYLMWPVSLWCGIAALGVYLLHFAKLHFEKQNQADLRHAFLARAAKELRDNGVCVAFSLGLLAFIQLFLVATSALANESTVRRWEDYLANAKDAVTNVLAFRYWWRLMLVLAVVAVLFPALKPVSFATKRRKLIGRLLLVLNTMNAFTFFSAAAVGAGDARWVLDRRDEAAANVARIRDARVKIVASAWFEQQIRALPPDGRSDLAKFLSRLDADLEQRIDQAVLRLPVIDEGAKAHRERNPKPRSTRFWTRSKLGPAAQATSSHP